ncbi:galactose oxidase [Lichtheimia hyalospora FSU 10163]|nr:galactose oxidase [Lichtheimia hyalospora FSU 10163]
MYQDVQGTKPCKRYGHTANLWNDNSILVFGGCDERAEYCNDIHVYDIEKNTWHQPEIHGSVVPRYLHSATVFQDKLFVYGGFARKATCTYVLDELNVLDLKTWTWMQYDKVPPRYNHSSTLVGHKMYIFGGKDEHGNTVSDLYVVNLMHAATYTPHLVLSGHAANTNNSMMLLKSQHFCEAICGKLLVFAHAGGYALWMLDLDTLVWQRQACGSPHFSMGGWNYFTLITTTDHQEEASSLNHHHLLFLGNTDPFRPQGYDHFRDAWVINAEQLGLYDIFQFSSSEHLGHAFGHLLQYPELSDCVVVPFTGDVIRAHKVILCTRWPYARTLLVNDRIELPEAHGTVMPLIRYLYTDQLDNDIQDPQVFIDLLLAAHRYKLPRLKKLCCERLYRDHMSIDHCGAICEKAMQVDEVGLQSLSLDFMFLNYGALVKSNDHEQPQPRMPDTVWKAFLETVPNEATLQIHQQTTISLSSSAHHPHATSLSDHRTITHSSSNFPCPLLSSSSSTTTCCSSTGSNHHANTIITNNMMMPPDEKK